MKIETIHEHSVDTSLLPDGANILDIGCRGFLFSDHLKELKHKVYCVDVEDYSLSNEGADGSYYRIAISDFDGIASIKRTSDPQATSIVKYDASIKEAVNVFKLSTFSKNVNVNFWDLIKVDIEGAEYQVIMSLEKAPARQLSIEFHLHTGVYSYFEVTMMENKLLALGYFPVKHDMSEQHGAGKNYWDSLWILK